MVFMGLLGGNLLITLHVTRVKDVVQGFYAMAHCRKQNWVTSVYREEDNNHVIDEIEK
jgi:hypothetical protein